MGQRVSGFERKVGDEYMTPEWVAETLLSVVPMYGSVWEPACGHRAIVRVIERECESMCKVLATDINPAFDPNGNSIDFLHPGVGWLVPSRGPFTIVTNPPYGKSGKLAEAFVRMAIEVTQWNRGRVCMLLPVAWDAAKNRQDLFEDFPAHVTKITLTERIRWTNLPQSKSGPSENHAWFVWDWSRKGRDQRWLGRIEQEKAA